MRLRLSAALIAAAATACVPQVAPQPSPVPPPQRVALRPDPRPAVQPVSDDWRDWPVTPGTWTYRQDARGGLALFGPTGSDALVSLRCDRAARRLYLSRAAGVTGSGAGPLTIRTTSMVRAVAMQPTGGTPPYVATALAPDDRLLDAMAFSRGHFTMERAGEAPGAGILVIPAWAEVGRVIEDCRG